MQRFRITVRIVLGVLAFAFFHYILPQHDIARITSTEIIRADFSWYNRLFYAQADSGSTEYRNRDLRLINTFKKKTWLLGFFPRDAEETMVYRNEDTGWIWPPYFKFDSSDLQAEASDLVSTKDNPQWVVITHYGWRNRLLTIYPNAVSIRPVASADVTIIPWFNIFFFATLIGLYFLARGMWRQFLERKVEPVLERAEDAYDRVSFEAAETRGRLRRWLDSWRDKRKR